MIAPEELMRMAVEKCRQGIAAGNSPFGCAIAQGDRVLAVSHNVVLATTDITAHAEVTAIREACRAAGNIFLEGAIVATTCEPCPMCAAALHWARVDTVYFGATIDDADDAGFNELHLPASKVLELGGSGVKLVPEMLREECRELFERWKNTPGARSY
ncbi:MAG TPA: nucleoside deaminase [Pirellulales bacterium]|jgi:tRNA(Arg) A34 adenosine deaminase TadA|nr:nucleoside deaminase [Pirellulales bacterium]